MKHIEVLSKDDISWQPMFSDKLNTNFVYSSRIVENGTILDTTDEGFDLSVNVNIKTAFYMIKAFLPKVCIYNWVLLF